jgi:dolichyl-phosphate beta-glucosyltransferase
LPPSPQGADIAIGSRWLESGRQTHRQPLYRQFFGRCFNAVTRAVMGLPFADTQCGFKAFTRAAAQTVFQLQTIERWGFDPEILFIALKRGYRVVEVPVSWAHDERTRMSYLKDGLKMLEEIAIIRWNALRGRYGKQVEKPLTPPIFASLSTWALPGWSMLETIQPMQTPSSMTRIGRPSILTTRSRRFSQTVIRS